ncbi:DUF2461 domain-containing protein [uncultured Oxalicibacterium sp.]|uniref:DUF2461 domain-containing protein n=1 Tax=uncultured Oxalicibacterium sp. TaxID=1168540 RepID=UPI0025D67718|nr:DUF2461 domain-containing protein [uncultured Oxalicibacterium sp.]
MHVRDLTGFLSELSENNNRAWFVMNKPRYDILRAEFLQLVIRLIANISRFDPAIADINPKKALFRINRDLRFAKDKAPYKTTFSAALNASGLKKPSQGGGPSYYFHIDAQGKLLIAAGEWMPPADRLRAIRQHVVDDPNGFTKVLKNKKLAQTFGDLQAEGKLIRPPKGFDADGPYADYLKLKSFIVWIEIDVIKDGEALEQKLLTTFKDAWPLIVWLREA